MSDPVITPGVNAYISLARAEEIAADYLFAKPTDRLPAALITASRMLDRLNWKGRKADASQELQWPRELPSNLGTFSLDTVPAPIARACVELAYQLLSQPGPATANVQMRQLGDSNVMFFPSVQDDVPRHVRKLIALFLTVPSQHSAEMLA